MYVSAHITMRYILVLKKRTLEDTLKLDAVQVHLNIDFNNMEHILITQNISAFRLPNDRNDPVSQNP